MTTSATLALMLLAHLVADYTLQGWLADGKQRAWWCRNVPGLERTKYRHDYVTALVCHALYWSILVCLPFLHSPRLLVAVAANTAVHAVVDDLKANRRALNLTQDQLLHLVQILLTLWGLS